MIDHLCRNVWPCRAKRGESGQMENSISIEMMKKENKRKRNERKQERRKLRHVFV
jgi:hypothetical protein